MNWDYRLPPWWWGWTAPLAEDRRNYNHTCVESSNIVISCKEGWQARIQNSKEVCTTLPCIEFPQISIYACCVSTRGHIRKVHVIFNGTNHHFGFDFRNKGAWRWLTCDITETFYTRSWMIYRNNRCSDWFSSSLLLSGIWRLTNWCPAKKCVLQIP